MMAAATESTNSKILILVRRREDISHEVFSHHWKEVHAPLASSFLVKHGILKYRQFHFLPDMPETLAKEVPDLLGDGLRTIYNDLRFDGMVEIEVPLLSMWAAALQDPVYKDRILPDEEKFIDRKIFLFGRGFDVLGVEHDLMKEPVANKLIRLTGDEAALMALSSIEGGMSLMDAEFISTLPPSENDTIIEKSQTAPGSPNSGSPEGQDKRPEMLSNLCDLLLHSAGLSIVPYALDLPILGGNKGQHRKIWSMAFESNQSMPTGPLAEQAFIGTDTAYGDQDAFLKALESLKDDLVLLYFRNVHPLFPIVDEDEFYVWYRSESHMKVSKPGQSLIFHAMLFTVFPYLRSDQILKHAFSTAKEGQRALFNRTKSMYHAMAQKRDSDYETSLAQAAALLSYWSPYDRTLDVNRYWIDEAFKHALAASPNESVNRRNRSKIIWWCCIVRDRLVSLGLRRGSRLRSRHRVTQLDLEDFRPELHCSTFMQSEEKVRMSKAFIALCHLTDIMKDVLYLRRQFSETQVLWELDDKLSKQEANQRLGMINTLNTKLSAWKQEFELENRNTGFADLRAHERYHLHMMRILYYGTITSLYEPYLAYTPQRRPVMLDFHHLAVCNVKEVSTRIAFYLGEMLKHSTIETIPITIGAWIVLPIGIHLVEINRPKAATNRKSKHLSAINNDERVTCKTEATGSSLDGLRHLMRTLHGLQVRFEGGEFVTKLVDAIIRAIAKRWQPHQLAVQQRQRQQQQQAESTSSPIDSHDSAIRASYESSDEMDPLPTLANVSPVKAQQQLSWPPLELMVSADEAELLDIVSRTVRVGLSDEELVG